MLNLNFGYDTVPQQRFWFIMAQNFPFYLQNEIRKRKNGRHLIFEEILAKLDQLFLSASSSCSRFSTLCSNNSLLSFFIMSQFSTKNRASKIDLRSLIFFSNKLDKISREAVSCRTAQNVPTFFFEKLCSTMP